MPKGDFNKFLNDLAARESSGNYRAINSYGYLGKYQFGEAALIDLGYYKPDDTKRNKRINDWKGKWTGKDGIYSVKDFLENPTVQEKAIREWMALLWKRIKQRGLDKYVGQEIDGIPITESGLLAAAHLKGVGALDKYLRGIPVKTTDGYGTDIREYLRKFGGYDVSPITGNPNSFSQPANPHDSQQFPPNTYTVRPGDTLSKIAKRFGVSVNDLLRANPWIKNPDYILPGWKLRIPSYAEKSRQNLNEGTRRIDPLVIDLNGDGKIDYNNSIRGRVWA